MAMTVATPNGEAKLQGFLGKLAMLLLVSGLAACSTGVWAERRYGRTTAGIHAASPTVVSAAGEITSVVAAYRALLGDPNNGGAPVAHATGRREINWDGVPDDL